MIRFKCIRMLIRTQEFGVESSWRERNTQSMEGIWLIQTSKSEVLSNLELTPSNFWRPTTSQFNTWRTDLRNSRKPTWPPQWTSSNRFLQIRALMITSWFGYWKVRIHNNLDVDPLNSKFLTYDQFSKNLSRVIKLSYPEVYVLFKACISG